jgi:hypothetical protein
MKNSATIIKQAGFKYLSLPAEFVDELGEKYGVETLGLWTFLCNQAENYQIRKDYICKRLNLSSRAFTRAMKNLIESGFSWLSTRFDGTKFAGRSYNISNLPQCLHEAIINYRQNNSPAKPPEPDTPKDESPTPALLRASEDCGDITKNELKITKNDLKEYVQTAFERFWSVYPRRQHKKKAQTAFNVAVAGMDKPAIVDLNTAISADINVRVTAPDYNPKYLPLPTTYLNGELWKDEHFVVMSTVERWSDTSWSDDIEL